MRLFYCLVTIPFWKPFLQYVMNISNYEQVFTIVLISLCFYVLFAFNNIIDSIFYGIGRTDYMLYQSLATNMIFYTLMFVLYSQGIYQPTLIKIALMFAMGMALDSILTFGIFIWILKKNKKIIISLVVFAISSMVVFLYFLVAF